MEDDNNLNHLEKLPIYKKGKEIYDVVFHITELFPDENEELQYIKDFLLDDAAILTIKIAGAERVGIYDIKMESATIIRKAANSLLVQNYVLEMFDFEDLDYYGIVRDLIEEFRLLFIEWVSEFDQQDYIIDRWGLFNPPGVSPFDHDPDEDIPYDGGFPFDE